jgi:hypothetical protein
MGQLYIICKHDMQEAALDKKQTTDMQEGVLITLKIYARTTSTYYEKQICKRQLYIINIWIYKRQHQVIGKQDT